MVNHWPIWIEYAVPLFPNGVVRLYATFQRGEAGGHVMHVEENSTVSIVSRNAPPNFHRLEPRRLRAIFQSTNFYDRFPPLALKTAERLARFSFLLKYDFF